MKQQNDWFTGIDYYDRYKEKEIQAEYTCIDTAIALHRHIQVELWYVVDGDADIIINGVVYPLRKDSFFCIYAHHMYEVRDIRVPVHVYIARFYIGAFMHMMWEKHEKGMNAQLVYRTSPYLACKDKNILPLMKQLYQEHEERAFGSINMMLYLALQIHMLFCRYALQNAKQEEEPPIWKCIQKLILSPKEAITLEECAHEVHLHPQYLNAKMKEYCGYTFHELWQFSIIINACALLHFEELSISYIADLLNVDNTATFYRIFEKFTGMKPMEYQKTRILDEELFFSDKDLFLQVQQYIYLYFYQDITLHDVATTLHRKEYTITQCLREQYKTSFMKELNNVRVRFACTLLKATKQPITQIAMDCGFQSLSGFQRSFYKLVGCTAKDYRNLKK